MTSSKLSDARAAEALFVKFAAAQEASAHLPPSTSNAIYDPRDANQSARMIKELDDALAEYHTADFSRNGNQAATLIRLRDASYPFVRFFDALREANHISPFGLNVPPGTMRTFTVSAYCMDSGLPSPKNGETFQLQPASNLIPHELQPLIKAMMSKPRSHARDTQSLVWTLRNAYSVGKPITLTQDAERRLETSYPGASKSIADYNRKSGNIKLARGVLDALLPGARDLVNQVEKIDPRRLIADTEVRLAELERLPVAGKIDPIAAYTTIAPGIAARTTSPKGGHSSAQIEIVNTTNSSYTFSPSDWVATSPRKTQNLALQVPERVANSDYQLRDAVTQDAVDEMYLKIVSTYLDLSTRGMAKAALQLVLGHDIITGEEVGRWDQIMALISPMPPAFKAPI